MRAALVISVCVACIRGGVTQHGAPRDERPTTLVNSARHTIVIQSFAFSPAALTVSRGDTVQWVNQDAFNHTSTSDSTAWSSPEISKGSHYVFVANQPGRFPYHCAAHPVMRGEIVVQ